MVNSSIIDNLLSEAKVKLIPLQASLELTSKCNHICVHCYTNKSSDADLSFKQWKIILDKLRQAGTLYIIFMGGEALLHSEFNQILEYAHQLSFHTSLITNGNLIVSKEYADNLKRLGLHNVTISLYSMQSKIHDSLTGVIGSHKKALDAIDLLLDAKINVGINSLLTKINIEGYIDLAEFVTKKNLEFNSDPVVTCDLLGKGKNLALRPTNQQIEKHLQNKIQKWPESIPLPFKVNCKDSICNMARSKCAVNSKGELIPCIEVREVLGSLLNDDFQIIWNNKIANKWRSMCIGEIKNLFNDNTDSFLDMCPGMGQNELGDPFIIPEFMKDLARIQKKNRDHYLNRYLLPFKGGSMLPVFRNGDELIIDFNIKKITIGDIVLYRYLSELIVHRVIEVLEDIYILKGDRAIVTEEVLIDSIIGVVQGFKRNRLERYWGKNGQLFKRPIAFFSAKAVAKTYRLKRRVIFVIIYFLVNHPRSYFKASTKLSFVRCFNKK